MPENYAEALAKTATTITSPSRPVAFELETQPEGLALRALHRPEWGALCLDWSSAEIRRRIQGGRRQLLPRALGLHKKAGICIVDATAGLGRDGFTLASLGASVILIERQPMMAALLRDAHRRALDQTGTRDAAQRIRVVEADALLWLAQPDQAIDAVHLDPMYPEDGKTALPQKAMQMLRDLTGGDSDTTELLRAALSSGAKRVAVKRSASAPWLGDLKPSVALPGTQARYDIYLP